MSSAPGGPSSTPETSGVNSIFQRSWWLDAVAPSQWRMLEVEGPDGVVARMPIVETRRMGNRCLAMPKLTQTLGPWLAPIDRKTPGRLAKEKEWLNALIDQLPPFDYYCQKWHHSVKNWMPFHWRGFEASPAYTYVIEDLTDLDRVWAGFDSNTRKNIRKAQSRVEVRADLDIEVLWRMSRKTYQRQSRRPPWSKELVFRLDQACRDRGARKILAARDPAGNIHGALLLVWDELSAYYLIGGGDPEFRNSGAMSLLMHEAIKFSSTVTRAFDFEGSMVEPIEKFMRGFGGLPKPYLVVRGYSRQMRVLEGLRSMRYPSAG